MSEVKPRIALSSDVLSCLAGLPQGVQPKVSKFITQFQADPTRSGINYEKIRDARDKRMRSVRIDQAYRGIVLVPDQGNIYILLWIDKHDDAYAWARRHKAGINPQTGTLQVYVSEVQEQADAETHAEHEAPGAFEALKDRELLRLGVPEEQIPLVRRVRNELELDAIEDQLPREAYEGLFYYLAGTSYDEIINDREQVAQVDIDDYEAALNRLSTQNRFYIAEDEVELQRMLNAPLDQWRVFLHPSQRRIVRGVKNGPVRVLGGAGTGKTVVAMHRARWLLENDPDARVLFTTFTRNLATDIEENLRSICSSDLMQRVEVVNLDQWVTNYLRKRNYDYRIEYRGDNPLWKQALDLAPAELGLPDAFYREEWERVIQPQNIQTVDEYKQASRVGRGTRLSRRDRIAIWDVFAEYRNLLNANGLREVEDAYADAAALISKDSSGLPYTSIIVDEAQDMGVQAFRLLRTIVPEGPNDLFIVGDGHQRIYSRNKVVLSRCGINIRGRSRRLRINYRTTEEIRRWAVNLLEGCPVDDLDGGSDTTQGYKSLTHGEPPRLEVFGDTTEQNEFIADLLEQRRKNGVRLDSICIAARTKAELKKVEETLRSKGIECYLLAADAQDRAHPDAVRLATMHRVKGLEFDEMILASLNRGLVPLKMAVSSKGDAVERQAADLQERALLYVAITRAKKRAILLAYGEVSEYIAPALSKK